MHNEHNDHIAPLERRECMMSTMITSWRSSGAIVSIEQCMQT